MEYVKGLLKKNLKKWSGKKWYHQRFDGAPYLIHTIAEAEILTDKNKKNDAHNAVHYCFFEDGKADWYIEIEDMKRVYSAVLLAGKKDYRLGQTLISAWQPQQDIFYKKCLEIDRVNLKKLTNQELIKLHDEFLEIILHKNSCSSIIDGFALGTDEIVAEMIQKIYESNSINKKLRLAEVFSILTAPVHLSFINQAEIELLKIAKAVRQGADKDKLLASYQKKYFWIRNNYIDANVLTVNHFAKELNKILSLKIDINKEIKSIKNTPTKSRLAKSKLIKKLKLSKELKFLLKTSEDFTYWQDERKRGTFWIAHYTYLILKEICHRRGITLEEIKYLSPREVSLIFKNKINRKLLQQRIKACVFYWDLNGHEAVVGTDYKKVMSEILGNQKLSAVDDFRGLTASMGKARGRVKILHSAKEVNKVEQGDILVAVMTRPDYVPAMKRAAAIITDEGGVTCHAAIISRELGIPCIIGTKIATKVLKDGMEVEVNANHSWVKIIK